MKECINCKAKNKDMDIYCRNCGCKIKSNSYYVLINIMISLSSLIILMLIVFIVMIGVYK